MTTPTDAPSTALRRRDVFALMFAMVFPTFGAWLYFVALAGHEYMRVAYGACKVIQFSLPVIWVYAVQRQPIQLRLPQKQGIAWGLLFGALVVALLLAAYFGGLKTSEYLAEAHLPLWEKICEIGADTTVKFLGLAIFISVAHSFMEEYYWRWFVFGQLRRGTPVSLAILLSSLAFMGHHIIVLRAYLKPEHFWTAALFFSLCVAAGGAVWAWVYHRTNSLYGPWLSHTLVDGGLMIVGYDLCGRYWTS